MRLEEAVTAYRDALEERTRDRVPFLWAQTLENLALAFEALFDKTEQPSWRVQALAAARDALHIYEAGDAEYDIATCRALIARLEAKS